MIYIYIYVLMDLAFSTTNEKLSPFKDKIRMKKIPNKDVVHQSVARREPKIVCSDG